MQIIPKIIVQHDIEVADFKAEVANWCRIWTSASEH